MTNFRLFQTADDNFKRDENVSKFSKRVENTVGKGESVSRRPELQTHKNQGLFWKGLIGFIYMYVGIFICLDSHKPLLNKQSLW